MKKYISGSLAIILSLGLVFGISAFTNHGPKQEKLTTYYYEFTGNHGHENDMSLWTQLSNITDYNDRDCGTGSANSCKIKNTTNSATHPTSVPLDVNGFPLVGSTNTDRVLKP